MLFTIKKFATRTAQPFLDVTCLCHLVWRFLTNANELSQNMLKSLIIVKDCPSGFPLHVGFTRCHL